MAAPSNDAGPATLTVRFEPMGTSEGLHAGEPGGNRGGSICALQNEAAIRASPVIFPIRISYLFGEIILLQRLPEQPAFQSATPKSLVLNWSAATR